MKKTRIVPGLVVILIVTFLLAGCSTSLVEPTLPSPPAPGPTITPTLSNTPVTTLAATENATPAIAPLPTMEPSSLELTYEDDFSDATKWLTFSREGGSFSYNNGEYCLSVYKPGALYYSRTNAFGAQSNFVASVDARVESASDDTTYGLEFGWNENNNFYYFNIKDNLYSIQKCTNGKWAVLQAYTESNYIKTDGSANQLEIARLGKSIEVYVNEQRLTTVEDDSLASGEIHLAAGGASSKIIFDNFKLYHFTNAYIMKAAPSLPVITTSTLAAGEVAVKYTQTLSASGGDSPYTWSVIKGDLPEGLSLVASTGAISGIPDMEGKYDFIMQVANGTGIMTQPFSITVTSLAISTAHLPDGNEGINYNFKLGVSGGEPPYTWSLKSGQLPDGLKLDASTGTVTGIPTEAEGPVTAFFEVTDSAGAVRTKGLSISIKLGDFQDIDEWAANVPASSETSIPQLVAYVMKPCRNDMEKAMVIYRWIAENIVYDVETGKRIEAGIYSNNPDQSAEAVFSRRNGVCEGYARLFKRMADYAGLQAVIITGWGKTDYAYLKEKGFKKNHDWNAVRINGQWGLIDTTWGADCYRDDKELEDFWFLTPPDQFAYTHYPDDPKWQLLETPCSASDITQHPVVKPGFFVYGLQLDDNNYPYYTVTNSLLLTVPVPPDVILCAEVFQDGQELKGNYTFCQRKDDANYEVRALFPGAGSYELRIYAKWQNESGLCHEAIVYQIVSSQSLGSMMEFPTVYDLFTTKGAYLYSPNFTDLQTGYSYDFKIMVPGAKKVAVISNPDTPSMSTQLLSKQGQLFEGTCNIVEGKIFLAVMFPNDDEFYWLLEYK